MTDPVVNRIVEKLYGDEVTGVEGSLEERMRALADKWDGGQDAGIEHVEFCQDFGCKTCVVIACANDLRIVLEEAFPPRK